MGQDFSISAIVDTSVSTEKDIRREREYLLRIRALIDFHLAEFDRRLTTISDAPPSGGSYDLSWGWAKKAQFVLQQRGKLLTLQTLIDLADLLYGDDPEKNGGLAKTKSNLSGQLNMNLNRLFMRTKISGNVKYFYYGLAHWFDENGKCKPEYLPE